MSREVVLKAENLVKYYPIKAGVLRRTVGQVKAVDGVSFELYKGETLGIVGESGCGKSTLGRMLMRLESRRAASSPSTGWTSTPRRAGTCAGSGGISRSSFRIPYTSLNPRKTVGDIIGEPFEIHPDVVPKGEPPPEGAGTARPGRSQPRAHQPLPAPVLRRAAPADRHRPRRWRSTRS